MHMPSWLWAAALVTGLGAAAGAHAQETSLKTDLARKHYQLGEKLYEVSRYEEAVKEFEKAYVLEPRPQLLFNIARTYEVLGELERAIDAYAGYLKEARPEADNRAVVEERLNVADTDNNRIRVITTTPPTP